MMRVGLLCVLALLLSFPVARADEYEDKEKKEDKGPTELERTRELLENPPEVDPNMVDFRDFLVKLRRSLAEYEIAPPRNNYDYAQHDAWKSILKPRAISMRRRAEKLMDQKYWVIDPATGHAVGVKPKYWNFVVREVAGLFSELGGALKQYHTVRLRITRPTGYGFMRHDPHRPGITYNPWGGFNRYPWGRGLRRRGWNPRGWIGWGGELTSYYGWWGRYNYAWSRWDRYYRFRRLARKKVKELKERNEQAFEDRRLGITMQLLSVRALTATLMAIEENRIRLLIAKLPRGDQMKALEWAETMRQARFEAERFESDRFSNWGGILRRKWLAPRTKLLKYLKKQGIDPGEIPEEDEVAPDEPAPADDGG